MGQGMASFMDTDKGQSSNITFQFHRMSNTVKALLNQHLRLFEEKLDVLGVKFFLLETEGVRHLQSNYGGGMAKKFENH